MPMLDTSFNIEAMRAASARAAALLKSLSNEDRLLLLCQLTDGERSVGELELLTGIAQPTLSQQLGVLRREALVHTRRQGKQIFYTVASPAALALLQLLYQQFCPPRKESPND